MALTDGFGSQPFAPALFMTLRTRQIELPLLLIEELAARLKERARRAIDLDMQRKSPRLKRHKSLER
jgi:hypothetical protein